MNPAIRLALSRLLAVLAVAAGALPTRAEEPAAAADLFAYGAPKRFKPERVLFPLGFAPSLDYTGFVAEWAPMRAALASFRCRR